MASGNDNYLIVNCSAGESNAATNQTLFHWSVYLYVAYNVDARMTGTVDVMDSNGNWARAANYSRSYPSGTWTAGNSYFIASGSNWLSRDASGGGAFMVSAALRTDTQGSSWSFSKSGSCAVTPARIVRRPSVPRNLRVQSVGTTSVVLAVDDPADWGNERVALLYRISKNNPPNQAPYLDNQGPGNVASFPTAGAAPLDANTTYYATAYAYNSAGYSDMGPIISFTTGAVAPAAPTNVVVSSNTATAATLTWTRNATSAAPYSTIQIQRQEWNGSAWSAWTIVQSLDGSATSASVAHSSTMRAYQYRVVAINGGGQGASAVATPSGATWNAFPSQPVALTNVAANRGAAGAAVLTWSTPAANSLLPGLWVTIEKSDGAGGWAGKAQLQIRADGQPTSWTDVDPGGGVVTYRLSLRTLVGTSPVGPVGFGVYGTTQFGPYTSVTLTIEAEPAAPTRLDPSSVPRDLARDQVFTWQHNAIDGSPQSAFALQYRQSGSSTWTDVGPVVSTVSSWTLPAGTLVNGVTYQWRVQTLGAYTGGAQGGWSPWSEISTFTGSGTPTVAINYPADGSVESLARLTVVWGYFDPEGTAQVRWTATLYRTDTGIDQQVESLTGSGPLTTATFSSLIADGATYRVIVTAQDGSGLWSDPAVSAFAVAYDPPGIVVLSAVWDYESATVGLSMTPTLEGGTEGSGEVALDGAVILEEDLDTDLAVLVDDPELDTDEAVLIEIRDGVEPASAVDVWRRVDDGPWVLLAEQVSPSSSLVDLYPTMNGCNYYRLVVWSDLPSTRVQDPAAVVCVGPDRASAGPGGIVQKSPEGVLSFGPTIEDQVRLCGVGPAEETVERDQETIHVDGARDPVWLGGTSFEETIKLSGTTTQGRAQLVRSVEADAPLYWRDTSGARVLVAYRGGLGKRWLTHLKKGWIKVSATLVRIGEASEL